MRKWEEPVDRLCPLYFIRGELGGWFDHLLELPGNVFRHQGHDISPPSDRHWHNKSKSHHLAAAQDGLYLQQLKGDWEEDC